MKVGRWVYNALGIIAERVKRIIMTGIITAIGATMLPIGFFLIVYSLVSTNISPNISSALYNVGMVAGLVGIGSLIIAMFQSYRDDKKTTRYREDLLSEIKGLRQDLRSKGK